MQNRLVVPTAMLVFVLSLSVVAVAQDAGQQAFNPHDLSGLWVSATGQGLATKKPPMTAEGKAKFDANKPSYGPRAVPPALGNDPMDRCDPLGLVRLLTFETNRPIEFLQTPGKVTLLIQYHEEWSTIWTDGRPLPKDPDPWWMGHSIGHWDGNTFVVEATGFDDRTWIDHFGDPHSDAMRVEERWHRVDRNTMDFTMTITDPKIYTMPWVWQETLKTVNTAPLGPGEIRIPQNQLDEDFCVPSEEEEFQKNIVQPAGGVKPSTN